MTTYRDAGVDIDVGEEVVRRIKPLVRNTFTPGVLADIGAFGGFFALDVARYSQPVLVSSVDGVGTKLKVAFRTGRHDTIGQDLVNHCVNDIAVCGADPLFFLDYFSTSTLDADVAEQLVRGLSEACRANGCALIGGETAEMPDIYSDGEYDLAGAVVGVVEKEQILDGSRVAAGDILIGIPSSGLHTNGYSLARRILFSAYAVHDAPEELGGETIGDALLRVHRSYLPVIRALRSEAHAFVHVTGGGIPGNTVRVIPEPLGFSVDYQAWQWPAIFRMIQRLGNVPEEDMRRTFNLGVGLIVIAAASRKDSLMRTLQEMGEDPVYLGDVTAPAP